ncbi:MAG: rhomboid family intramembrane serine protease [Acidobacteriota bacterium]
MFKRQTTGSVVCPNCGRLVGVRDEKCLNCGRPYPGLFGFTPLLNQLGRDLAFGDVVLWGCGILYVFSLAFDPNGIRFNGLLSMLSPSPQAAFVFGDSGWIPVFVFGRWWTVLSAGWLHGGLIHLGFNMYYLRFLMPNVIEIFGVGRAMILYVASSAAGFIVTSGFGLLTAPNQPLSGLPRFLHGAPLTLGASAALCGLLGALLYYARKTGHSMMTQRLAQMAIFLGIIGLVLPGVDNWAHLGGFVGGYLVAMVLRPLHDETPIHLLLGVLAVALSLASVGMSIWIGLRQLPHFERFVGLG